MLCEIYYFIGICIHIRVLLADLPCLRKFYMALVFLNCPRSMHIQAFCNKWVLIFTVPLPVIHDEPARMKVSGIAKSWTKVNEL